ncbi:MAG: GNAT family N-acetyltransferase [Thermomicrobiales bacterium]|nr:GNAT family N-acetyltransferase [Thermomicrobiales bacterium]
MTEWIVELPDGYRAVTPSMDDIPRATAFFNLVEISEWGMPDFDENEVEEEWADLDLSKSVVLVESESGEVVASMTLIESRGVTWEAFGYVHPGHQGNGLGRWIVDWSERTAHSRDDETRDGYKVELLNYISTVNTAAQQLLGARGYEVAKVFRRMRLDMAERPEPVVWPNGYDLRMFVRDKDERPFFAALESAFAEHWAAAPRTFEDWTKHWLSRDADTDLWVQLMHDRRVVGISCGRVMSGAGWIGYVGVIPEYRRRGLAKLILQESFGRFWDKGIQQVDLGVDSNNRQSAIDLYLGAGMYESHSYETNRKVLRDGLDWREDED